MPSNIAPLPKRFKIKHEFITHKFQYTLPLVGVDIEFLKVRRREVYLAIQELAKEIPKVNIANRNGMDEMDKVAHLLRWYHDALRLLNQTAYMINNPSYSKEYMLETESQLWVEASQENVT